MKKMLKVVKMPQKPVTSYWSTPRPFAEPIVPVKVAQPLTLPSTGKYDKQVDSLLAAFKKTPIIDGDENMMDYRSAAQFVMSEFNKSVRTQGQLGNFSKEKYAMHVNVLRDPDFTNTLYNKINLSV